MIYVMHRFKIKEKFNALDMFILYAKDCPKIIKLHHWKFFK